MSIKSITQVLGCQVGSSALKLVLIALADRADDLSGFCFPSIADTIFRTELDRKTVIEKMRFLEKQKIIVDTLRRVGRTKQVKVWRLDLIKLAEFSKTFESSPKMKRSQKRISSVISRKESRFSLHRVPKMGHGTGSYPSVEPPPLLDDLVEAALWAYTKNGVVHSNSGFKYKKRQALLLNVSAEDLVNWEDWQLWKNKSEQVQSREVQSNEEELDRRKLLALRSDARKLARQQFENMQVEKQNEIILAFHQYVEKNLQQRELNLLKKNGFDGSKELKLLFENWMLI
jgi:hypothetical protein